MRRRRTTAVWYTRGGRSGVLALAYAAAGFGVSRNERSRGRRDDAGSGRLKKGTSKARRRTVATEPRAAPLIPTAALPLTRGGQMGGRRGKVVEPTPTPAGLRPGVLRGWEGGGSYGSTIATA